MKDFYFSAGITTTAFIFACFCYYAKFAEVPFIGWDKLTSLFVVMVIIEITITVGVYLSEKRK